MGSVIAVWKGQCPQRDIQNELLAFLQRLAKAHVERRSSMPTRRPKFVDKLSAWRAENVPTQPQIEVFDQELTGRILVRSDVWEDHAGLIAAARRSGLDVLPEALNSKHGLLRLERVSVRGLDFQLYDPRDLYPGEDRVSFVFLQNDDLPELSGCLVKVAGKSTCELSRNELIQSADWFLESPFLHLRYYLEEWFDAFMAWVKFFFVPDLFFHRYEANPGYSEVEASLSSLKERVGYPTARDMFFEALLSGFAHEADQWGHQLAAWSRVPTIEGVRLVLPAWTVIAESSEQRRWRNEEGDELSLFFYGFPPRFAAPLQDIDRVRVALRNIVSREGAGLVEVEVVTIDDVPVIRAITKKHQGPNEVCYEGLLMLLRRDFSYQLRVTCRARTNDGKREDAVYLRLAEEYAGSKDQQWSADPYDPSIAGRALRTPADDEEWDAFYPLHPLSRCRSHLKMLMGRISLKADVKSAAPFLGQDDRS